MTELKTMLIRLTGLLGTGDLTAWEESFVESNSEATIERLTGKQVEIIERIFTKHFAG